MKKPINHIYFLTLLIIPAIAGCRKFVAIGAPKSEIESSQVFQNDAATISAALGVYAQMESSSLSICWGGATVYLALSADELNYNSSNTELKSFADDQVIANNGTGIYGRLWSPGYNNIYNANAVLQGIAASGGLTDSVKRQIKGEMLVVRSLQYFYLVNLFGDVPLELTPNYQVNSTMPRTPAAAIYAQIAADLRMADTLLKPAYPGGINTRPNKWTAAAFLSRVYLYQKDWKDAESMATSVIASGSYSLESDPGNVFSQSSAETIWQLGNDNSNTSEAQAFIPASVSSVPSYSLTAYLLAAFEPGDLRLSSWTGSNTVKGQTYYYPYKYKDRNYSPVDEYEVILRLGESYLIRAEARAQRGNIAGALEDINVIRTRAGLPSASANGEAAVLKLVSEERRKELFCEWGNRWLDLKRTGTADSVLADEKPGYWNANAVLYPIPLSELQNDPGLTQNPGY